MLRSRIPTILLVASLPAASCSRSEFGAVNQNRAGQTGQKGASPKNVVDAESPKILPETHFAAGQLFERQGQVDKAIVQYRKAVAVNHAYTAAYHRLGLMLSARGALDDAVQMLRRAAELGPKNPVIHNDLGFALMLAQRWGEAETELQSAVDLEPRLSRCHINLAMTQSKQGRFEDALNSFRKVLPEPDAHYNLGLMYRGQSRYPEAANSFHRVLEINPQFTAARTQLDQLLPYLPAPQAVETAPDRMDAEIIAFDEPSQTPTTGDATPTEVLPCPSEAATANSDETPEVEPAVDVSEVAGNESSRDSMQYMPNLNDLRDVSLGIQSVEFERDCLSRTDNEVQAEAIEVADASESVDYSPAMEYSPIVEENIASIVADDTGHREDVADETSHMIEASEAIATTETTAVKSEPSNEPSMRSPLHAESWTLLAELERKLDEIRSEAECRSLSQEDSMPVIVDDAEWTAPILDPTIAPETTMEPWTPASVGIGAGWIMDAPTVVQSPEEGEALQDDPGVVEVGDSDDGVGVIEALPSEGTAESMYGPPIELASADFTTDRSLEPKPQTIFTWSESFGRLDSLLAIVRNEDICWADYDAERQNAVALAFLRSLEVTVPVMDGLGSGDSATNPQGVPEFDDAPPSNSPEIPWSDFHSAPSSKLPPPLDPHFVPTSAAPRH